jgi:IMP dehydrogenase
MAIAMALAGGLGIIHSNFSVEEQLGEVQKVKRFCQGLIRNPVTLPATATVSEVDKIVAQHEFSTIPILEKLKFVGMVTSRDVDLIADRESTLVCNIMTSCEHLITCPAGTPLFEAHNILIASKKNALPLVSATGELTGLITRSDCKKQLLYPKASRDLQGRLICGAAISTRPADFERATRLIVEGEVDVLVIDSSQGNSSFQINLIRKLRKFLEKQGIQDKVTLIGGNVVTGTQARTLVEAGADALRVGMGSGSICTTQEVCAVGRPQGSAVYSVKQAVRSIGDAEKVGIIADGGIRSFTDIGKALVLGADAVMVGSFVAGCTETPGEVFFQDGERYKVYRGMGSLEAQMKLSGERYFYTGGVKVAQGVSGAVVDKGGVGELLKGIARDLELWLGKLGKGETLEELRGMVRFELASA